MWNRRKTVIIAGCSRFGASLAGEVSEHGNNVIVVDPDVLEEAGIWKASVVVAATNDDNVNCMLAQMARRIYDVEEVFVRLNDTDKEHLIGGLNIRAIYPARLSVEKFWELSSTVL